MGRPKKANQSDTLQQIKDTAWKQIAEQGAASLSLRAIARELKITAPAIYNYYNRRDDLVTALIMDAYRAFGDGQFEAVGRAPAGDFRAKIRAAGAAYREWAVLNPQRYMLIFGAPIPGYQAPTEKVMPLAARALDPLIDTLEQARLAGQLNMAFRQQISASLIRQLQDWQDLHPVGDAAVLYVALVIWSRVHGLMMMEIGNQYPPVIKDSGEVFRCEVEILLNQLFKHSH